LFWTGPRDAQAPSRHNPLVRRGRPNKSMTSSTTSTNAFYTCSSVEHATCSSTKDTLITCSPVEHTCSSAEDAFSIQAYPLSLTSETAWRQLLLYRARLLFYWARVPRSSSLSCYPVIIGAAWPRLRTYNGFSCSCVETWQSSLCGLFDTAQ
jgi:hypothetical protein